MDHVIHFENFEVILQESSDEYNVKIMITWWKEKIKTIITAQVLLLRYLWLWIWLWIHVGMDEMYAFNTTETNSIFLIYSVVPVVIY